MLTPYRALSMPLELEAVAILRAFWSGERSVKFPGDYYRVNGAHPGPHRLTGWGSGSGPTDRAC